MPSCTPINNTAVFSLGLKGVNSVVHFNHAKTLSDGFDRANAREV